MLGWMGLLCLRCNLRSGGSLPHSFSKECERVAAHAGLPREARPCHAHRADSEAVEAVGSKKAQLEFKRSSTSNNHRSISNPSIPATHLHEQVPTKRRKGGQSTCRVYHGTEKEAKVQRASITETVNIRRRTSMILKTQRRSSSCHLKNETCELFQLGEQESDQRAQCLLMGHLHGVPAILAKSRASVRWTALGQ